MNVENNQEKKEMNKIIEKIVKAGFFLYGVIFGELGLRLLGYRTITHSYIEKIPKKKNGRNNKKNH